MSENVYYGVRYPEPLKIQNLPEDTITELSNKQTIMQEDTTINIAFGESASSIQSKIDTIPKNLGTNNLTILFENDTVKFLNNAPVVDNSGNLAGTVAISVTGHGFVEGDEISIDGTTNYNVEQTLPAQTGGDADTLIITASYIAETPPSTAVVREPHILTSQINIDNFYNGTVNIYNNIDLTDITLRSTQKSYLKFTSNYGIELNDSISVNIRGIKISSNSIGLYHIRGNMLLYGSQLHADGWAFYSSGVNTFSYIRNTYLSATDEARVRISSGARGWLDNAQSLGTEPPYGVKNRFGAICHISNSNLTGSTANTLTDTASLTIT